MEEEDGGRMETMALKHTLQCVKQKAIGKLLYNGELSLALCHDLEGWDRGGGKET